MRQAQPKSEDSACDQAAVQTTRYALYVAEPRGSRYPEAFAWSLGPALGWRSQLKILQQMSKRPPEADHKAEFFFSR